MNAIGNDAKARERDVDPARSVLRANAEVAMRHAVASRDPARIALVEEWFRQFEAGDVRSGCVATHDTSNHQQGV